MELFEIIISIVSGGALITALTLPSTIKKARADARSAEAASKAAELENMQKVADGWEKLANERQEANEAHAAQIEALNGKIDYLYSVNSDWRDKYNTKCEEVSALKVKIATDEVKLCMVRGCKDREPQSGY